LIYRTMHWAGGLNESPFICSCGRAVEIGQPLVAAIDWEANSPNESPMPYEIDHFMCCTCGAKFDPEMRAPSVAIKRVAGPSRVHWCQGGVVFCAGLRESDGVTGDIGAVTCATCLRLYSKLPESGKHV